VDPRAEREVRVRVARQVELVRAIEHLGVAVRRAEQQPELGTARDLHAVELDVLERARGAEQRPPADARRVHGGLVAGVQQQDARADELVLGQALALVQDERELGDEVLAGILAALARERAQVVGELAARPDGVLLHLERGVQLVHLADVGRPRAEQVAIGLRHAEHLGDHGHGQRLGDLGEQVELACPGDAVDEPVRDRLHPRAQGLDVAGREGFRDQPPHPRVIRRLHVQDPRVDEVPERVVPVREIGMSHLGVGGRVQVRAPEPAIAQERVHVLAARDQVVVRRLVVQDRCMLSQVRVDGVGIGDERQVVGRTAGRRRYRPWQRSVGPIARSARPGRTTGRRRASSTSGWLSGPRSAWFRRPGPDLISTSYVERQNLDADRDAPHDPADHCLFEEGREPGGSRVAPLHAPQPCPAPQESRRPYARTPVMAAGVADHICTLQEIAGRWNTSRDPLPNRPR
jgi:hypothetical protein